MLSIGLIPILTTVNANVNAISSSMCEQILKGYLRPAKMTCRLDGFLGNSIDTLFIRSGSGGQTKFSHSSSISVNAV